MKRLATVLVKCKFGANTPHTEHVPASLVDDIQSPAPKYWSYSFIPSMYVYAMFMLLRTRYPASSMHISDSLVTCSNFPGILTAIARARRVTARRPLGRPAIFHYRCRTQLYLSKHHQDRRCVCLLSIVGLSALMESQCRQTSVNKLSSELWAASQQFIANVQSCCAWADPIISIQQHTSSRARARSLVSTSAVTEAAGGTAASVGSGANPFSHQRRRRFSLMPRLCALHQGTAYGHSGLKHLTR